MKYSMGKTYVDLELKDTKIRLESITDTIIRCIYTKEQEFKKESVLVNQNQPKPVELQVSEEKDTIVVSTGKLEVHVHLVTGKMTWKEKSSGRVLLEEEGKTITKKDVITYTTGDEEPVIDRVATVDGERNFVRNLRPVVDRSAYRGKLSFCWKKEEGIFGLGQAEEGIYNYRKHSQYLYQHNMRIPMPMLVSTEGYGIFVDCSSLMTFNDDENGSYLFLDTVDQIDYYFIAGDKLDDIITGFRSITGEAVMLPKWAYGYVQSKERYYTALELVDIIQQYRDLEVPIDCVVQDWNTWEPGNWGEKLVDKSRFGNLKECLDKIHEMNAHAMVSVWPNMNSGGKNHTEFFEAGYLLNDYATYNAFSEDARKMYWKQAKEELFDSGFDSWWCDSTEPFSGLDWGGETKREPWERYELVGNEHKHYLDDAEANIYALMHAKGIYENQRLDTEEKRVLNLTRSGYASGQKYGAVLWSGDIYATWETMKKQIVEGLNMGMSGYPYWTLDIGAFFTVKENWQNRGCGCNEDPTPKWFWQGDYEDGVKDPAYCELYTRWIQFGTFLPMFRSHGTDTPREIWNFGKKGEMFYDAIEKFIKLRYHFMPYIYSLAGAVRLQNATIMRSLLFDFMKDKNVRDIKDGFLFGPSLLVYVVTEPMYYEAGNHSIDREKKKECYLPEGADWYDFWTSNYYKGGQYVTVETPIDSMPLFVKAGAILPVAEGLQYADQQPTAPIEIQIYEGADGSFTLYEDEGNNYNYENGAYSTIEFQWNDTQKQLTIGSRQGQYPGMEQERTFTITIGKTKKEVNYIGQSITI